MTIDETEKTEEAEKAVGSEKKISSDSSGRVKELVIIGGGCSGARLAKLFYEHPEYNIATTLISTSKRYLHTPAAVRLCVQPELFDDFTLDLEALYSQKHKTLPDGQIPRVTFITGHVTSISTTNKTVTYTASGAAEGSASLKAAAADGSAAETPPTKATDSEGATTTTADPAAAGSEVVVKKFDLLVIATGSLQSNPLWGFSHSHTESLKAMKKTAEDLRKAKRVAIIGAGATGVEVAAEIVEKIPSLKGNVVVYAGDSLPMADSFDPSRSNLIVKRLAKMGVQVKQEIAEVTKEGESTYRITKKACPEESSQIQPTPTPQNQPEKTPPPVTTETQQPLVSETQQPLVSENQQPPVSENQQPPVSETHQPPPPLHSSAASSDVFDVVINAIGAKPNLDFLTDGSKDDPIRKMIDDKGLLKTDDYLRVFPITTTTATATTTTTPAATTTTPAATTTTTSGLIYAMGDVVSGTDHTWPGSSGCADVVYRTILVDLKLSSGLTKYENKMWRNTKIVTLGKKDGVGIVSGWPMPARAISWFKGNDFHVNDFKEVKPQ